jgi:hypothetical protein
MLKFSYAPLLVAARFSRKANWRGAPFEAEVWLVNDTPSAAIVERVVAELEPVDKRPDETSGRSAKPVRFDLGACAVGPESAVVVSRISAELTAAPRALRLTCEAGGKVIATNLYDLDIYLPPPQPILSRVLRRAADWLLASG